MSIPVNNKKIYTPEEITRSEILCGSHILHKSSDWELLIDNTNKDFYDEVISYNPIILETICALTYSLDQYPSYCPEYDIFNLARRDSQIVTLNHDNLAQCFIKQLKIHSLHGTITPKQRKTIQEFVPYMLDLDFKKHFLKDLYLATQENADLLLGKNEYINLEKTLKQNRFHSIIIIGYSFFFTGKYNIRDIVTYELIRMHLSDYSPNIVIIDPKPYVIADLLAKELNINNLHTFEMCWSSFAHAFFIACMLKHSIISEFNLTDQRRFIKLYDYFFENGMQTSNNEALKKGLNTKSCTK